MIPKLNENQRILRSRYWRTYLYLAADGLCFYCGKKIDLGWHADHFVPWSSGGKTTIDNLVVSCKVCNLKKGKKRMDEELKRDKPDKSSEEYERMSYFRDDFPDALSVRVPQIGAYNAFMDRYIKGYGTTSIFVPTGVGKTIIIRSIAIGLKKKFKDYGITFCFSPSVDLQQSVVVHKIDDTLDILQWYPKTSVLPFDREDNLDRDVTRNDRILVSFTTQFFSSPGKVEQFIDLAKRIKQRFGRFPVFIFDETHLLGDGKPWGEFAQMLVRAGIPVVVLTGTPYRNDDRRIPGFYFDEIDTRERNLKYTAPHEDPDFLELRIRKDEILKGTLHADYEYSYRRAWDEKLILKPEPHFVDAKVTSPNDPQNLDPDKLCPLAEQYLSRMKDRDANRWLRSYLNDDATIQKCVEKTIERLAIRKKHHPKCAAIVCTLSDEEFDFGDIHAKKILRQFQKMAPHLRCLIVTNNNNDSDGLKKFNKDDSYDILIVKNKGTLGFDCSRIKVVCMLTNYRTLPFFVQYANRGCRQFEGIGSYDLIMPKDPVMVRLFQDFLKSTALTIEELIRSDDELIDVIKKSEGNPKPTEDLIFSDHQFSTSTDDRNHKEESILEKLDRKFPTLSNRGLTREERLEHFSLMAATFGDSWLDDIPDAYDMNAKREKYVDPQEEEMRLQQDLQEITKEITMCVLKDHYGGTYNRERYKEVQQCLWTCLKRMCGLPIAQKISNLRSIDNLLLVLDCARKIRDDINRMPSHSGDFDCRRFFNRFR